MEKATTKATGWCSISWSLLGMLRGGSQPNKSSVKDVAMRGGEWWIIPGTSWLLCTCDGHFITAGSSWLPCVLTALESCVEACWGAAWLTPIKLASPLKKVTWPHEKLQWDGHWNGWFILVWGLTVSLAHSWGNLAVSLSVLFWMEDPLGVASLISLCYEIWEIFSEHFFSAHAQGLLQESQSFPPFFFLPLFYNLYFFSP